jgi:hypothetical protein
VWPDELGDLMGLRAADHGELDPLVVPGKELGNAGTGGYTGVKSEVLAGAGAGNTGHLVTQTVVSFPTGADASNYFTHAAASWVGCANHDIDYTPVSGDHNRGPSASPAWTPRGQ